jgi:hypothetical protein
LRSILLEGHVRSGFDLAMILLDQVVLVLR